MKNIFSAIKIKHDNDRNILNIINEKINYLNNEKEKLTKEVTKIDIFSEIIKSHTQIIKPFEHINTLTLNTNKELKLYKFIYDINKNIDIHDNHIIFHIKLLSKTSKYVYSIEENCYYFIINDSCSLYVKKFMDIIKISNIKLTNGYYKYCCNNQIFDIKKIEMITELPEFYVFYNNRNLFSENQIKEKIDNYFYEINNDIIHHYYKLHSNLYNNSYNNSYNNFGIYICENIQEMKYEYYYCKYENGLCSIVNELHNINKAIDKIGNIEIFMNSIHNYIDGNSIIFLGNNHLLYLYNILNDKLIEVFNFNIDNYSISYKHGLLIVYYNNQIVIYKNNEMIQKIIFSQILNDFINNIDINNISWITFENLNICLYLNKHTILFSDENIQFKCYKKTCGFNEYNFLNVY